MLQLYNTQSLDGSSLSQLKETLSAIVASENDSRARIRSHLSTEVDSIGRYYVTKPEDNIKSSAQQMLSKAHNDLQHLKFLESMQKKTIEAQEQLSQVNEVILNARKFCDFKHKVDVVIQSTKNAQYVASLQQIEILRASIDFEKDKSLQRKLVAAYSKALTEQWETVEICAIKDWEACISISPSQAIYISRKDVLLEAVEALKKSSALAPNVRQFSAKVQQYIIQPMLFKKLSASVQGDSLQLKERADSASLGDIAGISICLSFLTERLPPQAACEFQNAAIPPIIETLTSRYLPQQIPAHIPSTESLRTVLSGLTSLQESLALPMRENSLALTQWMQDLHLLWFSKYRNHVLCGCKRIILEWNGLTQMIEDKEQSSQLLSRPDKISSQNEAGETSSGLTVPLQVSEDRDPIDGDDWGWDVEDEGDIAHPVQSVETSNRPGGQVSSTHDIEHEKRPDYAQAGSQQEIVVARYAISTMARKLLDMIQTCEDDALKLESDHSDSPIAPAAILLRRLDTQILDFYRALVPLTIKRMGYPRMLIYNDCIFMANNLPAPDLIRRFGETFYSLEIQEKQEQILSIMSQANDFLSCNAPSQNLICYRTIQEVLDLLNRLQERYESQLSRTTMYTALGTLIETAICTMIHAVLEMTDISAAESSELAKMGDALTAAEDLFKSPEDPVPLAAMWCPSWFRFRLLLDILEAKLDYILDLFHKGELEDFSAAELCNLVRALFSDTPKRRNALEQIQSTLLE